MLFALAAACSAGSTPADLTFAPLDLTAGEHSQAGTHLTFVMQPRSAAVDEPIGPVTVQALDEANAPAADFFGAVIVTISNNAADLTLQGTTERNALGGLATFDDLSMDGAGHNLALSAFTRGLGGASSGELDVTAATWSPLDGGLDAGSVLRLFVDPVDPNTLYLATPRAGVFRSTDGGAGWQTLNVALGDRRIRELAMNGSGTLYAATESGLYQLFRGNPAWNPLDLGDGFRALPVTAVATHSATLYAAVAGRILLSSDAGNSWSAAPANPDTSSAVRLAIAPSDDRTLFASDGVTVVKSTDGASHFARWMTALPAASVRDLSFDAAGALYAATALGAFRLAAGATDWSSLTNTPCSAVVASPTETDTLYLADESAGLIRLAAGHATTLAAPPHPAPTALAVAPSTPLLLYMGSAGGGLFRFLGSAWSFSGKGLAAGELVALTVDGGGVLLAATHGGLYRSTDHAASWSAVAAAADPRFDAVVLGGPGAVALAHGSGWSSSDGGAHFTADAGWDGCAQLLFDPADATSAYCTPFDSAVTGVYHLSGGSRMLLAAGLPAYVSALAVDPATSGGTLVLWAGTSSGLYRSANAGSSWSAATPAAAAILAVAVAGAKILASTSDGAFISSDSGASWSALDSALNGATFFAFDAQAGLYASSDRLRHSADGATWALANSGLFQAAVTALAFDAGKKIYAATSGNGVFSSTE